jgi:membrane-associated phospholipid phosphatase
MTKQQGNLEFAGAEYRLTWIAVMLGALGALAVLHATGMVIELPALLPYGALLGFLLAGHYIYSKRRPSDVLSLVTGSIGLMIAASLLAGIIANAGLRLRYPLIDDVLAHADRTMGIDTPALVLAIAKKPWFAELLGWAYVSIFPLSFATAIWLACRRRAELVWEFTMAFSVGIVCAAAISIFIPALGNVAHAGLGQLAGTRLPGGSGVYHLSAVNLYRDGTDPLLDIRKLQGVVTFPSFHMIMALAVAYGCRTTRWLAWPMCVWCALVVVSTVPIGGHYVIDLLGGTALWLAFLALGSRNRMPWKAYGEGPQIAAGPL